MYFIAQQVGEWVSHNWPIVTAVSVIAAQWGHMANRLRHVERNVEKIWHKMESQ